MTGEEGKRMDPWLPSGREVVGECTRCGLARSLWDAIREQLPPGEHDEAKRVLGQRVRSNRVRARGRLVWADPGRAAPR